MARFLHKDDVVETSEFGGFCPYWTVASDGVVWVGESAEDLLSSDACGSLELDPAGVFHLLDYNHLNGDRTLVRGVSRMPWHCRLDASGCLDLLPPIPHDSCLASSQDIAAGLLPLLEEEIASACEGRKEVIIFLTGGLDSRVTAGVLHRLYGSGDGPTIRALTWGSLQSRDCVYARRIAEWYGWNWQNIPIESGSLPEMMQTAAVWGGAETSGIHLHGEDGLAGVDRDAIVLASSFGDSVGRAEFSSQRLDAIKVRYPKDRLGWINPVYHKFLEKQGSADIASAWASDQDAPSWAKCELDQQDNYMRRMIVHAMNRVRTHCALHQVFTSSAVVRYIWSFAPHCRTDKVYGYLFQLLDERLWRLPWARDGVAPSGDAETDMSLTKDYAQYDLWCRTEHCDWLEALVFSDELRAMGMFDLDAVRRAWDLWIKKDVENRRISEGFTKLATLALFIRHFRVNPPAWVDFSAGEQRRRRMQILKNRLHLAAKALLGRP